MNEKSPHSATVRLQRSLAIILVYSRPPLAFFAMVFAGLLMFYENTLFYTLGVLCLVTSMCFDFANSWFASRIYPKMKLASLAERIMNKLVYSIAFPLVAAGMFWRLHLISPSVSNAEIFHALFVLILCIVVLMRDHFAHFMRNFSIKRGEPEEQREITRLRTLVASPIVVLLYGYAFEPLSWYTYQIEFLGQFSDIPLRVLFFVEIAFLVINFGSMTLYCRKYGGYFLDELCFGDDSLRHQILSFFPNALSVMNGMMGALAVIFAYQNMFREAYIILIGAAIFDKLDGALARKFGVDQPLDPSKRLTVGSILDDISDMLSFAIAPALIFYLGMRFFVTDLIPQYLLIFLVCFYVISGITRLVCFTLDRHPIPGFFKGIPTPGAALFVTPPLIILQQLSQSQFAYLESFGLFCAGVLVFAGVLMNLYSIRYLHIGRLFSRKPSWGILTLLLLIGLVFTPYLGYGAFLYGAIYIISPLWTWRISSQEAAQELPPLQ